MAIGKSNALITPYQSFSASHTSDNDGFTASFINATVLLFPGNKEYAPDKCCILPQTLNTMLSNCKKHRLPKWKSAKMDLPLGVRYDSIILKCQCMDNIIVVYLLQGG